MINKKMLTKLVLSLGVTASGAAVLGVATPASACECNEHGLFATDNPCWGTSSGWNLREEFKKSLDEFRKNPQTEKKTFGAKLTNYFERENEINTKYKSHGFNQSLIKYVVLDEQNTPEERQQLLAMIKEYGIAKDVYNVDLLSKDVAEIDIMRVEDKYKGYIFGLKSNISSLEMEYCKDPKEKEVRRKEHMEWLKECYINPLKALPGKYGKESYIMEDVRKEYGELMKKNPKYNSKEALASFEKLMKE